MTNAFLVVQYMEKLSRYTKIPIIGISIGAIIVFLWFIIALKFKIIKDVALYLILGILILTIGYFFTILPIQKDIKTNAYVSYSGDFFVEDYYYVSRGTWPYILIKLPNEQKSVRYKILGNFKGLKANTTYTGTFIYGKNSKAIIDIDFKAIGDDYREYQQQSG